MELQFVDVQVKDFIATVTLRRPPVNALGKQIREELLYTFDAMQDRKDVRAIVLTGEGKVFCAGADLKEREHVKEEDGEYVRLNRLTREVFYSIIECPQPVIAAINGVALGAGFALTLCCDIIVASESAVFAMPEVDVGMAGGVKFLQRHFSPTKARRYLLTGQRVPAAELYRLGVVDEVTPPGEEVAKALEIAADIASKSPMAVKLIKDSFNVAENLSLRDGYRIEQNYTVALNRTEDAKEAKRAFLEKRKPVFVGR